MRRSACLALAVLTLLPAACGDDDASDDAVEQTTTTEADGSSTVGTDPTDAGAPCDPVALDPTELAALRPDAVPAGYELQPDSVGDTGPNDIADAIADDGEDDAEEVLREARFRRGYQWLWISGDSSQLFGIVYEFCDGAGVETYRQHGREATRSAPFEVTGLEGAEGFSGSAGSVGVARVLAGRGPYLVIATVNAEIEDVSLEQLQGQATDLAEAMVAKLPAAAG